MKKSLEKYLGRRSFLKSAAGLSAATAAGVGFWADKTLDAAVQNTNRSSSPTALRITDLRVLTIAGRYHIIRIDTNQGISGLGEVRDGASKTYALFLKSRILGENPCNIEKIFRKIRQFGGTGRAAGGVTAIEEACWDLAGKAYNVPVYQMLGGRYRDRIRCYCDTSPSADPKVFAEQIKRRKDLGFTWFKMDVRTSILAGIPGTLAQPLGSDLDSIAQAPGRGGAGAQPPGRGGPGAPGRPARVPGPEHTFTGVEITDKGIALMQDFVSGVRDVIGYDVPLSTDHFGRIGTNSIIKLGKAFEKFNLAWMEDPVPWYRTELLKQITRELDVATCTGEDIYLLPAFEVLCKEHAVDIINPDLSTSGGILETKRIVDMAQTYGIPSTFHMAGMPVCAFANVHCAAASEGFIVQENHSVDLPWWDALVDGVEKPVLNKGFIRVPDGPGLGIRLNEDAIKQHLAQPSDYFAPTTEWDNERSGDNLYT
ncbi:MAG: mandelate racemase/muconate lactonizing enzyme family protein [Bryobacterales bacterium]|nr:mandelate racemase/muconate lactonizing enzyme family protein [Bryobacterales bacterium]